MKAQQLFKKIGKFFLLDYFLSVVTNTLRLLDFGKKTGIRIILFPSRFQLSELPIDIVIPVIDKDADTLSQVIDSARENIKHPIQDIYLVCPDSSVLIKKIGAEKNCKIVDEKKLVNITPKDIHYIWQGRDRSAWLYQQFLKWSGGQFCTQRHYLVIDSDTIFNRPQVFEIDGKIVFDFCDEFHKPYFDAFDRIFGIKPKSTLSFTSHHALIDTTIVKTLLDYIESKHGIPWYQALINAVSRDEMSSISDYDNYGQYVLEKMPSRMCVRYWFNKSLGRKSLENLKILRKKYKKLYNTLSFHSYR